MRYSVRICKFVKFFSTQIDKEGMEPQITEKYVTDWMRARIGTGQFQDAASLAREFLRENHIDSPSSPEFSMVINVGFKLADEIAGQE